MQETTTITSRLANEQVDKEAQSQKIEQALRELGGFGNSEDIADRSGLDRIAVSRRTKEMERNGRIIATQFAKRNRSNNLCCCYRLPEVTTIQFTVKEAC